MAYAYQPVDGSAQKPNEKRTKLEETAMYWFPLHVFDRQAGREIDTMVFAPYPATLSLLDEVDTSGFDLVDSYTIGRNNVKVFYVDRVDVIAHHLDSVDVLNGGGVDLE